jgi:uncharacterized protein YeeX (DUF496 family)
MLLDRELRENAHRVLLIYNLSKTSSDEASEEVQEHEHFRTCRRVLKASMG